MTHQIQSLVSLLVDEDIHIGHAWSLVISVSLRPIKQKDKTEKGEGKKEKKKLSNNVIMIFIGNMGKF